MRTVHETEALRPSDPVPKHHSSNPLNKNQKLRLTFKAISSSITNGNGNGNANNGPGSVASEGGRSSVPASPMTMGMRTEIADEEYEANNVVYIPAAHALPDLNLPLPHGGSISDGEMTKQFPPDINFTDEELALPPEQLLALLKLQVQWASEESEVLRKEVEELEEKRRVEWSRKELSLENLMEAEAEGAARREPLGPGDSILTGVIKSDVKNAEGFRLTGDPTPWWREPRREKEDVMEGVETAGSAAVVV